MEEGADEEIDYELPTRDQGFRRAIVTAYDHRCALCGIRMLTPDGHTAVDAAHIVPWSISHNDDPRNGMALCRLCHWTFDKGLVGVSPQYEVIASAQLVAVHNMPGHLLTLKGRAIIGPLEEPLWPDRNSLKWHRREIFRARISHCCIISNCCRQLALSAILLRTAHTCSGARRDVISRI